MTTVGGMGTIVAGGTRPPATGAIDTLPIDGHVAAAAAVAVVARRAAAEVLATTGAIAAAAAPVIENETGAPNAPGRRGHQMRSKTL
jgi:hypothetical protein